MSKNILILIGLVVVVFIVLNYLPKSKEDMNKNLVKVDIFPISHATVMMKWGDKTIITDPVGGASLYNSVPMPHIVLITDIHGDHFDMETLKGLVKSETTIVAPQAVVDMMDEALDGRLVVMANGESVVEQGLKIEAIPMYNIPEAEGAYHIKGRGNGYVLDTGLERIYVSGDTSGTPEMKALQNIDIAFVCMNLPYTMTEEEAALAVVAFSPKKVIPYHYRGSDVNKFKDLVNASNPNIEVELLDFYTE